MTPQPLNRPCGKSAVEVPVHVSNIRVGDTVLHNGRLMTVGRNDVKRGFMGHTIFGDSYRLGTLPVTKVEFVAALAAVEGQP